MYSFVDFVNVYGLLACALCLLWYYSTSTFDFWKKRNIKFKKPFPFFGNTGKSTLLLEPMHVTLDKLYTSFGDEPYGGIFQLRSPSLLVKDPQLVTDILIKDFSNFPDHEFGVFVNYNKDLNPLNEHVFAAEGERWRVLRQKMSPTFTSGKLKLMHEQIYGCVKILDEYLASKITDDDSEVKIKKLFQGLTIDVIGTCAFGISYNATSSEYNKFREMCEEGIKMKFRDALRISIGAINKKILNLIKMPDLRKHIQDFFLNLTLDMISYRRDNGINRNDALQLLINLQNTHRDKKFAISETQEKILKHEEFDEIDVAANAFLFLVAGFETTAATLSFCAYELALNAEIQNKLRLEAKRVHQKYQKQTPESLKELTYMDCVIKETLRKYPPIGVLGRRCRDDYVLSTNKIQIPAGTSIAVPVWSIHHDPKYYPNPEIFDPDRFNSESGQNRPNGTYLPFGEGPRLCLGKRFAEMELKSALAELILKYDFSPSPNTEIPLTYKTNFVLQPARDLCIRITKRKERKYDAM